MNADKTKVKSKRRRRAFVFDFGFICVPLCLSVVPLFFSPLSFAQPYPSKPIRLIVPFPPGGGVDGVARIAFARVAELVNQQIVIDNRGGSSGIVATELAARVAPDGYTLFFGVTSALAILPHYQRKLPYDVLKDFAPINLIADGAYILSVHPAVQAASVKALIALAKQKPGALNFSSAGNGTMLHLNGELFKNLTGIDIVHVPYKGAAAAMTDLISGQVQLAFNPPSVTLSHMKSGRLRALAVTSARRSALAPELPTIAEAGVPGYEATGWYAVLAPARTPADIITRLNRELMTTVADKEVRERFFAIGVEAIGSTPAQFADFIRSEYAKWGKVVRSAGVKSE
jgi:tripartite-type tricarboxylate transporter receptor subunit TctC